MGQKRLRDHTNTRSYTGCSLCLRAATDTSAVVLAMTLLIPAMRVIRLPVQDKLSSGVLRTEAVVLNLENPIGNIERVHVAELVPIVVRLGQVGPSRLGISSHNAQEWPQVLINR